MKMIPIFVFSILLFITCLVETPPENQIGVEEIHKQLAQIETLVNKGYYPRNLPDVLINQLQIDIQTYNDLVSEMSLYILIKADLPHTIVMCYSSWVVTYQFAENLRVCN